MDVAAGGPVKELSHEVTCSLCLGYFKDPVITRCGHSFCRACLTRYWLTQYSSCPQCSEKVHQKNLKRNWQLAKVVEIAKKFREEKRAKRKGGECERHGEPLKLFCKDDAAPICVVCEKSKEHRGHAVVSMEEAAQESKEEVQGQLKSLEKGREKAVNQKLAEEQRIQKWLAELAVEKQTFTTAYEQVHNFLEEKKCFCLSQLVDLEKEMENRQGKNVNKLSEEISRLSGLIKEREEKCHQPASEFLQDIRRSTLSRHQEGQLLLDISPNLEERLRSYSQKNSVLKDTMEKFEGSLALALNKVNVTLDPETAHPFLLVSEDLKSVRNGGEKQDMPDNPERFDIMPCVLGQEKFTSGRHWWEVEVENEDAVWGIGVAKESLKRKGKMHFDLSEGVWAVWNLKKDSVPPHLPQVLSSSQQTVLTMERKQWRIRVSLDYEKGQVDFFSVDKNWLISIVPSAAFSGEGIRPFFFGLKGVGLKC